MPLRRLRSVAGQWLVHVATWCLYRFKTEEKARSTFEYLLYKYLAIVPVLVVVVPLIFVLSWLQTGSGIGLLLVMGLVFFLSYRMTVGVYESDEEEIWRRSRRLLKNSKGVPSAAVTATFAPIGLVMLVLAAIIATAKVFP